MIVSALRIYLRSGGRVNQGQTIGTFRQGQHICAIYDTRDEQRAVAVAFISEGLVNHECCAYAAGTRLDLDDFRHGLALRGWDVARLEAEGALILMTIAEAHLSGGSFDCERMLGLVSKTAEHALAAGFAGLRACGDMSWLLGNPPGAEQVVEYEARLNELLTNVRAIGLCQYDRSRLPLDLLDHAITTHSTVVIDDHHTMNPFYRPMPISTTEPAQPNDVGWKLAELRRRPADGASQ